VAISDSAAIPSPRGFGEISPPNKAPRPPNLNMKHYKSVDFLSNLNVKPPWRNVKPPRTKLKQPIQDFLSTVLLCCRASVEHCHCVKPASFFIAAAALHANMVSSGFHCESSMFDLTVTRTWCCHCWTYGLSPVVTGEGFGGLIFLKRSSKTPKLKYETL